MQLDTVPPPALPLRRPRPARRSVRSFGRAARKAILPIVLIIVFAFPFYWVVVTSLNTASQAFSFPPVFLPHGHWENYARAWSEAPWLRFLANTVFISAATVALVLFTSILAGFAFGVMRFRGKAILFLSVLAIMMIPRTVLLIPDYILLDDIHWLDTYWAQIVPWGASVFGIFLIRQFFLSLPPELLEAAELDGASQWRFLWRIAVPIAKPALITVGLYIFIGTWDSFLWPFIVTSSASVQPIEVGLSTFYGANGTDWTGLSAAVVFTTLPVMIVFLIAQRQFMTGAMGAASGLKG